jgi:hypothetical protein
MEYLRLTWPERIPGTSRVQRNGVLNRPGQKGQRKADQNRRFDELEIDPGPSAAGIRALRAGAQDRMSLAPCSRRCSRSQLVRTKRWIPIPARSRSNAPSWGPPSLERPLPSVDATTALVQCGSRAPALRQRLPRPRGVRGFRRLRRPAQSGSLEGLAFTSRLSRAGARVGGSSGHPWRGHQRQVWPIGYTVMIRMSGPCAAQSGVLLRRADGIQLAGSSWKFLGKSRTGD